jgi:hypothetical protein
MKKSAKKSPGKKKMGRPSTGGPKPMRQFRMADEEWRLVQQAAQVEQETVSEFARATLLARAKKLVG